MDEMDRLFDFLDEAVRGAKCKCSTTTKAYLNLARKEGYDLARSARTPERARKFRAAANYIGGLIARLTWNEKSFTAARTALEFWRGFEDGLRERTMGRRETTAYRRGYQFGKDGA